MKSLQILIALVALLTLAPRAVASLYGWIDEQGRVHYSDRFPPEESDEGRAIFNQKGVKIREVPPPKSKEEIEREARRQAELERLRNEQQKLAEEQRQADERLLRAFPTEEDIILARDDKVEIVDLSIQLTYTNLKRMKQRLLELKTEAEEKKRRGVPVSASYGSEIDRLRQQIEDAYAKVLQDEQKKAALRNEYQQHARRYRELKHLALTPEHDVGDARDIDDLLDTVISCERGGNCAARWQRTLDYARQHATTPVALEGESIFLTAPAARSEDISITASLIPHEDRGRLWIFLDLQCPPSAQDGPACHNAAADAIRAGFKQAVSGGAPD